MLASGRSGSPCQGAWNPILAFGGHEARPPGEPGQSTGRGADALLDHRRGLAEPDGPADFDPGIEVAAVAFEGNQDIVRVGGKQRPPEMTIVAGLDVAREPHHRGVPAVDRPALDGDSRPVAGIVPRLARRGLRPGGFRRLGSTGGGLNRDNGKGR